MKHGVIGDPYTHDLRYQVASCVADITDEEKRNALLDEAEWIPSENFYLEACYDWNKKGLKGVYIGNITRIDTDENISEQCIVTKYVAGNQTFRCYYVNPTETEKPILTFATRITEEGKEELIFPGAKNSIKECPEYEEFLKKFIKPLEGVEDIDISHFIKRKEEEER